jgi:hypothetical protein
MAALKPVSVAEYTSKPLFLVLLLLLAMAGHFFSTLHVKALPRPKAAEQINVAISPEVQIALSAGDMYLASNLAVFRATIVSVQDLDPADYRILAKVQDDASRLNPAQGDNYYIAQGVLPWVGEHPAAITILERATQARRTDFLPPYFLGFDYMYFEGKFDESGRSYLEAANRVEGKNRDALLSHAAKFTEKGTDPASAIEFINGLIKSTRNQGLQHFLRGRILRLEGLIELREAAEKYAQQYHRPPVHLDDLVESGILKALPTDPLGAGYRLDEKGVPQIVFQIKRLK